MTHEEELELLTKVRDIHAAMLARREQRRSAPSANPPATAHPPVAATPMEKHDPNDPTVTILPKHWKGENLRGRRFSECPPIFLGQLSHLLDAFADKNELDFERAKYAKKDRENAEAARRWRAKLEAKSAQGSAAMTQEELDATF